MRALEELHSCVWRGSSRTHSAPVIPTGFTNLDRHLPGGGWPHPSVTEVFLDHYGIGELALLIPGLTSLMRQDEATDKKWIVWVAPPFIPYAPALMQHGMNVDRLLMVHPSTGIKNCHWAVEQAVRSGSSAAVVAWMSAANGVVLRRLQLASEKQWCWTVLFRPMAALQDRSPAALRIRLFREDSVTRLHILKCRGGRPAVINLKRADQQW